MMRQTRTLRHARGKAIRINVLHMEAPMFHDTFSRRGEMLSKPDLRTLM